jgi:uncharacterized protein YeaO (DUF488 family)
LSGRPSIKLKRIYEPPEPEDGYRVLSSRYWPRGVPKTAVDEYSIKTSPSRELLREYKHEGLAWEDYVPRYLEEMNSETAQSAIRHLASIAERGNLTLMCLCEDEQRCHRSLLRSLVRAAEAASAGGGPRKAESYLPTKTGGSAGQGVTL